MNLYRVTCRGMQHTGNGQCYGIAYVVANNPDAAYRMLRANLDSRSLGFEREREMEKIELIATEGDYPDCGHALLLPEPRHE